MPTVDDLLSAGIGIGLVLMGGRAPSRPVQAISLQETLDGVGTCPPDSLVVITPRAADERPSYEFDIAVRRAAAAGVAAMVLLDRAEVPVTTARLAERSGVALLSCRAGTEVATVLLALDQALREDVGSAVNRALTTGRALVDLPEDLELAEVLGLAGDALECPVRLTDSASGHPVVVGGALRYRLHAERDDVAAQLAMPVVAYAVARWQERRDRTSAAPEQARAEVLADLVVRDAATLGSSVSDRLRVTGFRLDALHVVVCLTITGAATTDDLLRRRSEREQIRLAAVGFIPDSSVWSVTAVEDDVVLVRTEASASTEVAAELEPLLTSLAEAGHGVCVGIGSPQSGMSGLRQSAGEARVTAAGLAATGAAGAIAVFDATGVARVLSEVAASWVGRRMVTDLLAPFDALGPERARTAVATLAAYLDARGSLREAGQRLHLHPNAVGYRMRRIREQTTLDLDDADVRFALALACRVRLLQAGA